jgi:hypothetical protein
MFLLFWYNYTRSFNLSLLLSKSAAVMCYLDICRNLMSFIKGGYLYVGPEIKTITVMLSKAAPLA